MEREAHDDYDIDRLVDEIEQLRPVDDDKLQQIVDLINDREITIEQLQYFMNIEGMADLIEKNTLSINQITQLYNQAIVYGIAEAELDIVMENFVMAVNNNLHDITVDEIIARYTQDQRHLPILASDDLEGLVIDHSDDGNYIAFVKEHYDIDWDPVLDAQDDVGKMFVTNAASLDEDDVEDSIDSAGQVEDEYNE